jgi:N-acetylated-alpha-linked acidic dipeptidase
MAGLKGDLESAEYVRDTWIKQGLTSVKLVKYDVFLSFPNQSRPNSIAFNDEQVINITETLYDPELANPDIPLPFLAFAASGSFTSQKIYYANYGTLEDFKFLKSKGFNLSDSIVIVRYGQIFRGNKVKLAAQYGAKAVLIYDDIIRAAPEEVINQTYPNGEFLPGDGMQRGTLFTGSGDPLTPMYPAIDSAYRIKEEDSDELPNIVAQVIGYDVAKQVLEKMTGEEVVDTWKGGINGITYKYGGLLANNQNLTVNVYNYRDKRTTYNVVGVIEGETEPDRYVIIGNHRDAWVIVLFILWLIYFFVLS